MSKKLSITILMVLRLILMAVVTVGASSTRIGPYKGIFVGTIYDDAEPHRARGDVPAARGTGWPTATRRARSSSY